MSITFLKRLSIVLTSLACIVGYGFFVFAAAPAGGYTPGQTLDPDCAPGDSDCSVRTAWTIDTANSLVYNTTEAIGIGTSNPTRNLDVAGTVGITNTSATTTLTVSSTNTSVTSSEVRASTDITHIIDPVQSTDKSEYYATRSRITYDPNNSGFDMDYTSSLPTSGGFRNNLAGNVNLVDIFGSGSVNRAVGNTNAISVGGSGSYSNVLGTQNIIALTGSGTIENTTGLSSSIYSTNGTMTYVNGTNSSINGDPLSSGTPHITTAVGNKSSIFNVDYGYGFEIAIRGTTYQSTGIVIWPQITTAPFTNGIENTNPGGEAFGLRIDSLGSANYAITADSTYGVFISDGALQGTTNEYALYIADQEAENFFANGARIGVDDVNAKLSNSSGTATGTTTLYIGNETITTSISDQRLKTNITNSDLDAIDYINQFKIVSFDWLDNNPRRNDGRIPAGLLAQDVESIAPQYVRKTNNPDDYISVRFEDLVPVVMKAVQELDLKLDTITLASNNVITSESIFDRFASWLADTTNTISEIIATTIRAREQLCIDDVCITKDDLRQIIENQHITLTETTLQAEENASPQNDTSSGSTTSNTSTSETSTSSTDSSSSSDQVTSTSSASSSTDSSDATPPTSSTSSSTTTTN